MREIRTSGSMSEGGKRDHGRIEAPPRSESRRTGYSPTLRLPRPSSTLQLPPRPRPRSSLRAVPTGTPPAACSMAASRPWTARPTRDGYAGEATRRRPGATTSTPPVASPPATSSAPSPPSSRATSPWPAGWRRPCATAAAIPTWAKKGLGLLLIGPNGVGKTHLAVSVLRELVLMKGCSGQFWDFHELIREIKNSYDSTTRNGPRAASRGRRDGAQGVPGGAHRHPHALAPAVEMCLVVRLDGPDYRQSGKRAGVFGERGPDPQPVIPTPRPRFGG